MMELLDRKKESLKLIQFIGATNKSDFVLYFAHVLTKMKKRVLIADFTQKQIYQGYTRTEENQTIYDFHGIDILNDAEDWLDIEEKLKRDGETTISYDLILIDIDYINPFHSEWPEFNERIYVGDYDRTHQLIDTELLHEALKNSDNKDVKRITFQSSVKMDVDVFFETLPFEVKQKSMHYLFEPDELQERLRIQMQHEQIMPFNNVSKQHQKNITDIVSELYTLHVKEVEGNIKNSFLGLPLKFKKA